MTRLSPSRAQQLRLRESQIFLALTLVVGILAGLSAVLFSLAIDLTTRFFFGLNPSSVRLFLIPPLVSLLTGLLLVRFFPDVRGSGVPQTKAAFHLKGGFIPARVPFGKFLTGVLCIASGHSIGREGPSVQIGAGIASVVGRWLPLSPNRVKDLLPVGAAGALAAAFNTPVAAVLFALEEIIGDLNAALIGSTVLASVAAVVVERSILGNEPLFRVPEYHLVHPAELLTYGALGVLGGFISVLFCRGLLGARAQFLRLPPSTRVYQPALGGLVIGAVLLHVPEVMGVGYEYVDQALNGGLVFQTMMLLCLVKVGATIVSYSSGNAGGIFAPSLYVGAMAGGALGTVVQQIAPFPTADAGAYALVGMGTLFAGIIRAPMTSVFMIFEITQDYQILVPLMIANLLSFFISRRYQPVPVYHALLQQDQVHLPSAPHAPTATGWTAQDVMTSRLAFVGSDWSIASVVDRFADRSPAAYVVGTPDRCEGVLSTSEVNEAMHSGRGDAVVASVLNTLPFHVHPDHPADVVLERFARSHGALPIVRREHAEQLVGVVTADSILQFLRTRANAMPALPD